MKIFRSAGPILLFLFLCLNISWATETVATLDFSGSGPLFLTKIQIRQDLQQAERLLHDNYVRYPILAQAGVRWKMAFRRLEEDLLSGQNPPLTHHFQKQLIRALEFSEDSSLRADLFLSKRHYTDRVEPRVAFYSGIRMARQGGRFRVLPPAGHPAPDIPAEKIVNYWFVGCATQQEVLFPILPERQTEARFILGQLANHQPEPLLCVFENGSAEKQKIELPLMLPESELNRAEMPIYEFRGGRVAYLRWYRDGTLQERAVKKFQRLARKLRRIPTLILDVRGNRSGSFAFIEKWLKELTRAHWKNVIVRERQTPAVLKGLLNRVQWNLRRAESRLLIGREQLEQKHQQLQALLLRFQEKEISEKWVETKFIFNGKDSAPAWETRLIVVADQHCGNGCQFLVALAKQLPDGIFVGTGSGPFPAQTSGPIYQLKHSRIMLSLNHRLHLNHKNRPVSPSGYLPDYWLFPPDGISDILRFAGNRD